MPSSARGNCWLRFARWPWHFAVTAIGSHGVLAVEMRKSTLALATILTLGLPSTGAQTQQSDPKRPQLSSETRGNVTNVQVVDPALVKQAQDFATLRQIPGDKNTALVPWLMANAHTLPPSFVFETARRLWEIGRRDEAFEWFALAYARARYDAARCVDTTAPQGIAGLPPIAANVQAGIDQFRSEFGAAGLRALSRPDAFSSAVSPWWICSHGIAAVRAGLEKRSIDQSDWLKPEAEWTALRSKVTEQLTAFFTEQGRPQDDPIPISKTLYEVTAIGTGNFRDLHGSITIAACSISRFEGHDLTRLSFGSGKAAAPSRKSVALWVRGAPVREFIRLHLNSNVEFSRPGPKAYLRNWCTRKDERVDRKI